MAGIPQKIKALVLAKEWIQLKNELALIDLNSIDSSHWFWKIAKKLYLALSDYSALIDTYKKHLNSCLSSDNLIRALLYSEIAEIYFHYNEGTSESAIEACEKAITLDPKNKKYKTLAIILGDLFLGQKKYDDAVTCYLMAKNENYLSYLVQEYLKNKQYKELNYFVLAIINQNEMYLPTLNEMKKYFSPEKSDNPYKIFGKVTFKKQAESVKENLIALNYSLTKTL